MVFKKGSLSLGGGARSHLSPDGKNCPYAGEVQERCETPSLTAMDAELT